jgi:calcium-dependent protein kinase
MHRDLKPENIMFQKKGDLSTMMIVDFGLAQKKNSKKFSFPKCGTPGYVAPEIANLTDYLIRYSEVCDIFSCGAIMYKL